MYTLITFGIVKTSLLTLCLLLSQQILGGKMMEEKTYSVAQVVCFQVPWQEFETSAEWEITSFFKTTLLQREPFLTMCYAINSSLLLITK